MVETQIMNKDIIFDLTIFFIIIFIFKKQKLIRFNTKMLREMRQGNNQTVLIHSGESWVLIKLDHTRKLTTTAVRKWSIRELLYTPSNT